MMILILPVGTLSRRWAHGVELEASLRLRLKRLYPGMLRTLISLIDAVLGCRYLVLEVLVDLEAILEGRDSERSPAPTIVLAARSVNARRRRIIDTRAVNCVLCVFVIGI